MSGEILSERRGFFARLPDPPRLDARALFWWGIALVAFRAAWNGFVSRYATDVGPQELLDWPLSDLLLTAASLLGHLGIVLAAVALGARSISRDADRGLTASPDSDRRFLAALPQPPRLEARALLWWGIGLIAVGIAGGHFLPDLVRGFGVQALYQNLAFMLVVDVISTSTMLGITLVAIALGVRSLAHDVERAPLSDR